MIVRHWIIYCQPPVSLWKSSSSSVWFISLLLIDKNIYPPINSWTTLQSADKHLKITLLPSPSWIIICFVSQLTFQACKIYTNSHISGLLKEILNFSYFYSVKSPSFQVVSKLQGHPHKSVKSNSQQFFFLFTMKFDHKQRYSIIWQWLPSFDEVHFCLHEI